MLFIVTKCEVTVDGYHVIDNYVGSCWIDDLNNNLSLVGFSSEEKDSIITTFIERCD